MAVIGEMASQAIHILDCFHIASKMGKAIDEVRAQEAREIRAKGLAPVLKHSRWTLLNRPANRTKKQKLKLKEFLRYNLKTTRAYLLKESFQHFWTYRHTGWAEAFLDNRCAEVMSSRIEPMKKFARSLRRHRYLNLN